MRKPTETRRSFEHLAQRVFNVPLMIEPTKAEVIAAALQQRLGILKLDRLDSTSLDAVGMQALAGDARRSYENWKPFHADGQIAVIPVEGTLVHKFGWLDPMSGMTGYDGIARKLRAALADNDIRAIWLDIDSPGGEVPGCFALAHEIALATQTEGGDKPIWAYVNEQACSAAYALACVCDRVYGPADAMVGSIGAYVMHVDFTKMLDKEGIAVRIIRAGARKAKTGPYEKLDDPALTKLQDWVDDTRDRFADLVAMGRGLSVDYVLDTEADWFTGPDAVDLGLMDGLMGEQDAWNLLLEDIR
ncbi:MAG: serine peptidase [Sphingobium sp.]|nr:MAG: serine peptidase [Sphingobium sp.]